MSGGPGAGKREVRSSRRWQRTWCKFTRAPICHHSACCARTNHQRRRDDRSLYRPNDQPIHGLRCNHPCPRPWEAADLPPFRRRAIPKGNRFGPGPSSATPPRRRHQLAGVARKILRRTRVFNLRRTKTKHSVHTRPMEAQRHGPGVSRVHKTLCRCWNPRGNATCASCGMSRPIFQKSTANGNVVFSVCA